MSYVPTYSEVQEEIVSVTLNLSNYVIQKEFKNVTKVGTSSFALKANVTEIKKRVDDTDVAKINSVDELQGKNYVKDSYLYLNQEYEYFGVDKVHPHKLLSWKSAGISNEKLEPPEDKNSPKVPFEKIWPYLKTASFKFLPPKKIYHHKIIVNIYIVYSMPDITEAKGSEIMKFGLFGATGYDTNNKLIGCGLGFGTQKYTYDDGKKARKVQIHLVLMH